jgi:hypothetical protein
MTSKNVAGHMMNAKGRAFELEIAKLFTAGGFDVRGLEQEGDHLCIRADGVTLHSECKRQEVLRIPLWWRQTLRDCPQGALPVLTFRQSRQEPLSLLRTADLIRLLGGES